MTTSTIRFHYSLDSKDRNDGQYVIYMMVKDESFPIIKLVSKKDMYSCGLQKNYQDLVEMHTIAEHIMCLLQAYADIGLWNESFYNALRKAYVKFISTSLSWEKLSKKQELAKMESGWE